MARSFDHDPNNTVTLPNGRRAHRDHVAQNEVIKRRFESPCDGVWTLIGNGLSNQTFVKAPDGIIAIDTGECIEEMQSALRELRKVDQSPIIGVLYTHFHYVDGTKAIVSEGGNAASLAVYGHERITKNKARASAEVGPAYSRGLVEQFAIALPTDGPDGAVSVGLGFWYRNPEHAPYTTGHVPVNHPLTDGEGHFTLGGMRVEWAHAPSDADDSINYFFPSLGVCVQNTVWPALFNVYAIRGEEYRDPRLLLAGYDRILKWAPEHLVGAHGPAISGRDTVNKRVSQSRDAIQFLWDQTVRGINKGWTTDELASRVRLPDFYDDDYLTAELYGVAEHHVRQIHAGLRGWFDGDESKLFPVEPAERYERLIAGFGGRDAVAKQASDALGTNDVRWALELATWLARSPGATDDDRALLARCLRTVGERTPAANIRNWTLTRARHLDRSTPMDRYYVHRFQARTLESLDNRAIISTLRVTIEPTLIEGINHHVAFIIDGDSIGLHVRNGVAVPTDGANPDSTAAMSRDTLVTIVANRKSWSDCTRDGSVTVTGNEKLVDRIRAAFDVEGLRS